MIGQALGMAGENPAAVVETLHSQAKGAAVLAGHALGFTPGEMDGIASRGLPNWLVGITCLGIGALVAMRYAPDRWVTEVRRFGR
jgi:hypothetical protein